MVPAYKIETTVALTNRVPTTVVRGAGRPQAVFAMERLMDRVARELELDRAEVRARNMIQPGADALFGRARSSATASRWSMPAAIFPRASARALELSDYDGFRARQAKARAEGRYLGIGIGNYVEGTGLGPFEGVTVRVLPNGKVAVATGATTQGQGTAHDAVADRRRPGRLPHRGHRDDARATPRAISQGIGAFASRQAINAGSSALIAGDNVRKQVIALASRALGVPEAEIDVEDGRAIARTGNKPIAVARRARAHGAGHAGLLVRARPDCPGSSTPPISRRRRRPIATARTWSRSRSIR